MKVVRAFRMLRATRMIRLLRQVPELVVLLKGIKVAAKTVFFTFLLLAMVTYGFSIIFQQLTYDSEVGAEYFDTIPRAMKFLMVAGCFPDLEEAVDGMGGFALAAVFVIYIVLTTFTLLNMLTGVMIDAIVIIAAVEKEEIFVENVRDVMESIFKEFDGECDGRITSRDFERLLMQPDIVTFIEEIGVDVCFLVEFSKLIFKNQTSLSHADIISLMLDLRGQNPCLIANIAKLQQWMNLELETIEGRILSGQARLKNNMFTSTIIDPRHS